MVSSTRGVRITGEERQQLMLSYMRRYQAGEPTIRSLAADTSRRYGFVQGLRKDAGGKRKDTTKKDKGKKAESANGGAGGLGSSQKPTP